MGFDDMTRAEVIREMKQDAAREEWYAYGPKCATCTHGVAFSRNEYPYALSKDVAYCRKWGDLFEDPYESNAEIEDCWEG